MIWKNYAVAVSFAVKWLNNFFWYYNKILILSNNIDLN